MEYFQKIADLIKDDFNPLSDHPELTCLGDFPLQMAYVHKDQEALLVLGQEPVCFMLLTKAAAGGNFWKRFRSRRAWLFMWDFRNGRAWLFIWDFRNKPARQENEKAGRGADDEKK